MKKIFVCVAVLGSLSTAAFADQPANTPPPNSNAGSNTPGSNAAPCGATHGAFASVNGNFGFLGQVGGTPGYHNGATGQDPGATGYNNSNADCQKNSNLP